MRSPRAKNRRMPGDRIVKLGAFVVAAMVGTYKGICGCAHKPASGFAVAGGVCGGKIEEIPNLAYRPQTETSQSME